jgi:hypothetical protein
LIGKEWNAATIRNPIVGGKFEGIWLCRQFHLLRARQSWLVRYSSSFFAIPVLLLQVTAHGRRPVDLVIAAEIHQKCYPLETEPGQRQSLYGNFGSHKRD